MNYTYTEKIKRSAKFLGCKIYGLSGLSGLMDFVLVGMVGFIELIIFWVLIVFKSSILPKKRLGSTVSF